MDRNKIQEYLKELKSKGFDDSQYQEILGQQRIVVKEYYIIQEKIGNLIGLCQKHNFSFDLTPMQHQGKDCIHIEITDRED